jgi:hypothetical protein
MQSNGDDKKNSQPHGNMTFEASVRNKKKQKTFLSLPERPVEKL